MYVCKISTELHLNLTIMTKSIDMDLTNKEINNNNQICASNPIITNKEKDDESRSKNQHVTS